MNLISGNLFERFKTEFMRLYQKFEYEFDADVSIFKSNYGRDNLSNFSIEFFFTKKKGFGENFTGKDVKSEKYSKKEFSKGKKIVYVMCLVLAMNSIESVD